MKVSVLMPVWNREKYINECIDSILAQTFTDFELILVDDGSSDNTVNIIKEYSDSRIKLFECPHKGIVDALNFGLTQCTGEYVARMDSDDIMFPNRLKEQVEFLDLNKDYQCLCSIATDITGEVPKREQANYEITLKKMVRFNPIIHPTVIFRRHEFLDKNFSYKKEWEWAESVRLWIDMLEGGFRIYKTDTLAVKFRMHEERICFVERKPILNE